MEQTGWVDVMFKGTPRDLAYTAAKWLVIFIGVLFLLYVLEVLWFLITDVDDEMGVGTRLLILPVTLLLYLQESVVIRALGTSILGWTIAFVGIFLANGAQRFAAFVFGFATFAAASGLINQNGFAAIPSVLALGYLSLWAWSLRNQIAVAATNPADAENLAQQRSALKHREINQEEVISRR